jgi:hypothetical protein
MGPFNPIRICMLQMRHLGHMQTILCWDYVIVMACMCELYCCIGRFFLKNSNLAKWCNQSQISFKSC